VIIDEAHHLRTLNTRRRTRVVDICASARVLLLSATPIHNSIGELHTLAALFHAPDTKRGVRGIRRCITLRRTVAECAVINQGSGGVRQIPPIAARGVLQRTSTDSLIGDALLALPALNTQDDEGHALLRIGLVHAWRSSVAALERRLQRRIAVTIAIEHACDAGVAPTALLRRAFRADYGAVQLAMPLLLSGESGVVDAHALDALRISARTQRGALEQVLHTLCDEHDQWRAVALRRLARWSAAPLVAFTQFAATAERLYYALRREPGIALLTGSRAQIASGRLSRAAVLERLLDERYRTRRDAVRLLITTDVLSEGLSLSGVGTVIHLDQPWTAARLEQRVGRAARIEAPVQQVNEVHLPASIPAHVHNAVANLLRQKRRAMQHVTGRESSTCVASLTVQRLIDLYDAAEINAATIARGWSCRVSPTLTHPLTIAVVCLRGRRTLVAYDGTRLRAPSSTDWSAVVAARDTNNRDAQATACTTIQALRSVLEAYIADSALCDTMSASHASRYQARRESDAMLIAQRGTAQLRAIHATRHADVATRLGARPQDSRVRVYFGMTLLPGATGRE
jgi:hypothetical protein